MTEIWKRIKDFPLYEISNLGRVRSYWHSVPKILKPWLSKSDKYLHVTLYSENKSQRPSIHSLVAKAFLKKKPSLLHEVAHKNGKRLENRVTNLKWATHSENMQDCLKHGTDKRGEKHPLVRLTKKNVIQIRKLRKQGTPYKELSKRFGVCESHLCGICKGNEWAWL